MSSSETFLARNGLHLQISIVACQAIESGDPAGYIKDSVVYHNICEYYVQESGTLRFILLLSDSQASYALDPASSLSIKPKLEPTVYLAIANRTSNGLTGFKGTSLANYYVGQEPCQFELAEGAVAQALVMQCLSSLPMHSLFNLLGQGYTIVMCGRQFGGMVAHAFAAKFLLQVQTEIQMAKKMGINLSALSRVEDKVISFALCSPLFANTRLHEALAEHNLHTNLHTLWIPKDGSMQFLSLCCDLLSAQGKAEESTRCTRPPVGPQSLLDQLSNSRFKAVQNWANAVHQELESLSRLNSQAFATEALELRELYKLAQEQDPKLHESPKPSRFAAAVSKTKMEVSIVGSLASPTGKSVQSLSQAKSTNLGSSGKLTPTVALAPKTASSVAGPTQRVSSPGVPPPRLSIPGTAPAPRMSTSGTPSPKSSPGAPISKPPHVQPTAVTWQESLKELLEQAKALDLSAPRLQPVGQFWILENAHVGKETKDKPQSKVPAKDDNMVHLVGLTPSEAVEKSSSWLRPDNKQLFKKWEYSLQELQRDLIEVYAWSTFKTTLEIDGRPLARKDRIRPTRMELN